MTSSTPKVSVVLPVYNGGKYLDDAIKSIRNQSFKNFEFIILNDGSTDRSIDVIKKHAGEDPRIVVIDRENRGLVETLNEGIRHAKTDLVARMDADDICEPERFRKQVEYLDLNPKCVVVGARVQLIDPDGYSIREMVDELTHDAIDAANLKGEGSAICHPTAMFRREAALKHGAYREEYKHAEDVDFFLRLAEVGQVANLKDVLLKYRQHPKSVGYAHSRAQMLSARAAARDALKRRNLPVPKELEFQKVLILSSASDSDVHRKWVWWALASGNLKTARRHLVMAFLKQPLAIQNLRQLFCVLRGY